MPAKKESGVSHREKRQGGERSRKLSVLIRNLMCYLPFETSTRVILHKYKFRVTREEGEGGRSGCNSNSGGRQAGPCGAACLLCWGHKGGGQVAHPDSLSFPARRRAQSVSGVAEWGHFGASALSFLVSISVLSASLILNPCRFGKCFKSYLSTRSRSRFYGT